MVSGLHDWIEATFVGPDLGLPVSNTHKELRMSWVTFERVDWSVMRTKLGTKTKLCFNLLSFGNQKHNALLRTNEELGWTGISVVLHGSTAQNLGVLVVLLILILEVETINGLEVDTFNTLIEFSHIPEE